ncbi:MAG: glycine cleavage system protein GcvH [Methanomassiliicoccales archaeon]|nr:glycine cleavage system protein GcvH [Methanomassiliicoccales archaeon]MDD1756224.1 glycine cleavage system protein GcvH [Methanomassiliicoccales archaeon]
MTCIKTYISGMANYAPGTEMSSVPDGLHYTKEHEWLKVEGANARVGITDHAQHELTEIVYVELPKVGKKVKKGDSLGVVESVKTVSDIYSPVTGEVVEANKPLEDSPQWINESPYEKGWLAVVKMSDPGEVKGMLDAAAYKRVIEE